MPGGFEPLSPFESLSELLNSYVATHYLSKTAEGGKKKVAIHILWKVFEESDSQ